MLRRLVSWDPVLDNSSDSPELLSGSMLAEMLLSPHNRSMTGLLAGPWEAVNATDDPGTCRCIELKAAFADQEQTAMDIFNEYEVEVIIPLVEVAATQSLILSEDANITPPEEESMCEDPFDLAIDQWKD